MHASPSAFLLACLATPAALLAADLPPEQLAFFESKVRPVLAQHCYECHSAEAKKVKGGLLLDTRAGWEKGGDTGPAIIPGEPDKSLLIQAVRHADDDLKMPKQKIAEHEIAALAEWVQMGVPDPRTGAAAVAVRPALDWEKARKHWAYLPIREPAVPRSGGTPAADENAPVADANPIDAFIHATLAERGLAPLPTADRRTLLRRVTYDLTGLPPSPEDLAAYNESYATDGPHISYEKVIDRLLASPAYGERWGRHWMDLVRYADTAGDNSDYPVPQLWRYRNYVIDAFNSDKSYDQFLREQIAGDLLPARDQAQRNEQIIATGYVALSRRFGSVVERYPQHLTIEDTIDNIGKTMLGLSIGCARCHDHKFDAITQRDYTALYGIFESTRYAFPGIELLKIQKDFVPLLSPAEMEEKLGAHREKERELRERQRSINAQIQPLIARKKELDSKLAGAAGEEKETVEAANAQLRADFKKLRGQTEAISKEIEKLQRERPPVPDAYAVQDDDAPADAKVFIKGEPERVGETVPRRWLELFGAQPLPPDAAGKTSGRLQLANWITSPENPLTARVLVNRVWQQHFGAGLVGTPNDFGVRGLPPTHPALLDWLASRFMAEGWSLKKLHKRILLSEAYQRSSVTEPAEPANGAVFASLLSNSQLPPSSVVDPDNHYLWRANRRRLDAESLRDTLLALSGSLDRTPLAEPHPFPPPEKWGFTQHFPFRATYPSNRRSVYLMTARLTAAPFFQAFDGPDRNATTPARDSSVTSVQALYFMNDEFVHEQATRFAARILGEASDDPTRLTRAFTVTFLREPTPAERSQLESYLTTIRTRLLSTGIPEIECDSLAWASLTRALFRMNEFVYLD